MHIVMNLPSEVWHFKPVTVLGSPLVAQFWPVRTTFSRGPMTASTSSVVMLSPVTLKEKKSPAVALISMPKAFPL